MDGSASGVKDRRGRGPDHDYRQRFFISLMAAAACGVPGLADFRAASSSSSHVDVFLILEGVWEGCFIVPKSLAPVSQRLSDDVEVFLPKRLAFSVDVERPAAAQVNRR